MAAYPLNHGAFALLTGEAAYWAGLLMADGCVYQGKYGQPKITLTLAKADVGHLQAFRRFVGATEHKLHPWSSKGASWNVLAVFSAAMARDLARVGIVPRKSLHATAGPAVTGSRDFWRGVVDGDGSIGVYGSDGHVLSGNGKPRGRTLTLYSGSERLLRQFLSFVRRSGIKTDAKVRLVGTVRRVAFRGTSADAVVSLLYRDATVGLPRKMQAAQVFL